MSTLLPYRRSHRLLLAFVLVNAFEMAVLAVAGLWFGFADTFAAITGFQQAHPWSYLPSLVLLAVLVTRWERRR